MRRLRGRATRIFVLHRGQWNRSSNLCPGTFGRINDLRRGLVQNAIVYAFSRMRILSCLSLVFILKVFCGQAAVKDLLSLPLFSILVIL